MGHETRIQTYDGKLSKKTVISKFLDSTSDECDCDFPSLGPDSFKDCYPSGNSPEEIERSFDEVLSKRYWQGGASIALVEIHDAEKAWKSKANLKLRDKIQEAQKEIRQIQVEGLQKIKEGKTKKCPSCGATHPTDKLYNISCPTCRASILGKGLDTKIGKLNEKIKGFEQKQKDLVLKQKKIKQWFVGIEFHV